MLKRFALGIVAAVLACGPVARAQVEFEVATIKPVEAGPKDGRFLRMTNDHTFLAKNVTLKQLVSAAYEVNPSSISGATGWMETQKFVISARTPGDDYPSRDVQMAMLRKLLEDRFHLVIHKETRTMSCYELTVAKDGSKLQDTKSSEYMPQASSIVSGDHVTIPAKNASMTDFSRTLQRVILDKPVIDKTGLTGRYDFTLEWAPDESQFEGAIPPPAETKSPPLLVAIREQLGLELKAAHEPVETVAIDSAAQPEAN